VAYPMTDRTLQLLDAILEAFDLYHTPEDVDVKPGLETFCNLAVNHVLARMGYEKFKGMVANQMIDALSRSSDWEGIPMDQAQVIANAGGVVLAGEASDPHGHVVVVRPGIADLSAKWHKFTPKVSHVGGKSLIGKSAAYAFPGADLPGFWKLKEG
jgi:hypothetical protein